MMYWLKNKQLYMHFVNFERNVERQTLLILKFLHKTCYLILVRTIFMSHSILRIAIEPIKPRPKLYLQNVIAENIIVLLFQNCYDGALHQRFFEDFTN